MSDLKMCNKCEGVPVEDLADCCGFPNCYGTHEEMTVLALDQHKEITRLKERLEGLKRENEMLRLYGNKDCTAMADEALGKPPTEEG